MTMETTSRLNQQIKLNDGRFLGFDEYGVEQGKPVFVMHGFPGSRLDYSIFDPEEYATELNVRILAVDRPGFGRSDFKKGRGFLDWPDDIVELADKLQMDQFAVLALSGGGPYGAACAYKIPDRLTHTAIVCGMGPADAPGSQEGESWTLPGKPSLIRRIILFLMVQGLKKDPQRLEAQFLETTSGPDRDLLESRPEILKMSVGSWGEGFRQGIGGVQYEAGLYKRPWGFQLEDIETEVHLWHGEKDNNVPSSVGHYVADAIPDCQATFIEDEGHFSLLYNHMREILSRLLM